MLHALRSGPTTISIAHASHFSGRCHIPAVNSIPLNCAIKAQECAFWHVLFELRSEMIKLLRACASVWTCLVCLSYAGSIGVHLGNHWDLVMSSQVSHRISNLGEICDAPKTRGVLACLSWLRASSSWSSKDGQPKADRSDFRNQQFEPDTGKMWKVPGKLWNVPSPQTTRVCGDFIGQCG